MTSSQSQQFSEWLRQHTALGPRSILKYDSVITRYLAQGGDGTIESINSFIHGVVQQSRSTYVKYAFKHYLAYLGMSDYPKVIKVRERLRKKDGCYLPAPEIETIVNSIDNEKNKMVALIQFTTGARAHDVLGFSKDNFIRQDSLIMRLIPKGEKKELYVVIPDRHAIKIMSYANTRISDYPFLDGDLSDMRRAVDRNYSEYWKDVRKAAKICGHPGFSTHDFRRNYTEDLYKNGVDLRVIRDALGHARLETTIKYLHSSKATLDDRIKIANKLRG